MATPKRSTLSIVLEAVGLGCIIGISSGGAALAVYCVGMSVLIPNFGFVAGPFVGFLLGAGIGAITGGGIGAVLGAARAAVQGPDPPPRAVPRVLPQQPTPHNEGITAG